MAGSITIPFWPASPNCLSWSKDNAIAVAGGECIAILNPRLKEAGPNGTHWDTILIAVNAFTKGEIPRRPLLSSPDFSTGEESTTWTALQASWSSPGLARHRGCALAVLTSNHTLSIWAADGKACTNTNWHRQTIVNHAVQRYYQSLRQSNAVSGETDLQSQAEREQISQRLLAFAWSHPLHLSVCGQSSEFKRRLDWGHHFLAVATGCGDILILRIHSSYSERSPDWGATLTGVIKARNGSDQLHAVDAIAWSEWDHGSSNEENATIAYTINGSLFTTKVYGFQKGSSASVEPCPPLVSDRRLQQYPAISPGRTAIIAVRKLQFIVAFGSDAIHLVPIKSDEGTTTHHLDNRYDETTGLTTSRGDDDDDYKLHVVSHLLTATARTAQLTIPFRTEEAEEVIPSWQHCINEARSSYSAQFDLEGNVFDRTYGIASSPIANYVATCSSMHPSDTLGYVIGSEQTSTVHISLESMPILHDPFVAVHHSGHVMMTPIEPLIFTFKRLMESHVKLSEAQPLDHSYVARRILYFLPQYGSEASTNMGDRNAEFIVSTLRLRVYADARLQTLRASHLAGIVLAQSLSRNRLVRSIVQVLVTEVLKLDMYSVGLSALGLRIRRLYEMIALKLKNMDDPTSPFIQEYQEECQICKAAIPFTSPLWAICIKGHQFSRCGLTFLPIQQPGTTKSCALCDALFLDERKLLDSKAGTDSIVEFPAERTTLSKQVGSGQSIMPSDRIEQDTSVLSFVEFLFATFDVCIYCGGRFQD